MERPPQNADDARLSLIHRGPTHALLRWAGLLAPDGATTARTGVALALFAWLPLALLVFLDFRDGSAPAGPNFFTDFNAYARVLLAPFILIVTERSADLRLRRLLDSFVRGGLVPESSRGGFGALLEVAGRRCGRPIVEILLLLLAFALSTLAVRVALGVSGGFWAGTFVNGAAHLTPAGWWLILVAQPLLMFLVLRWLWRFGAWILLFRAIARLPLELVATHPDRAGGLGFMALFPKMFVPFVFALSCIVAASALYEVVYLGVATRQLATAAVGWLVLMLAICVGPMLTFMPTLLRFKERRLIEYGEFVARHGRAAERVLETAPTKELPGAAPISSLADIGIGLETIRHIKPLPVDLPAIISVLLAAALPMLPVVAVEVPIVEILKKILGALV